MAGAKSRLGQDDSPRKQEGGAMGQRNARLTAIANCRVSVSVPRVKPSQQTPDLDIFAHVTMANESHLPCTVRSVFNIFYMASSQAV